MVSTTGIDKTGNFITENGRVKILTKSEAIRQNVRQALLLIFGEWFNDATQGVDWFGTILTKDQRRLLADREIRETVMSVDGVVSISVIDFTRKNNQVLGVRVVYRDQYEKVDQDVSQEAPIV